MYVTVRRRIERESGFVIIDGYEVQPLTADRFDDLVHVLGKGGIGGCWCMYWTCPSSAVWSEGAKGGSAGTNKHAFREIVDEGPPPGLLAYDGDEAVGWCRVMRRTALPGLANSRYFKTELDIEDVWSLACFVVRTSHRGSGLTTVLTRSGDRVRPSKRWRSRRGLPDRIRCDRIAVVGLSRHGVDVRAAGLRGRAALRSAQADDAADRLTGVEVVRPWSGRRTPTASGR
jgi:hypothetical protein